MSKSTGYVLKPRLYRTSVMPPNVLEDSSRFGNLGTFVNHTTWVQRPSRLWVLGLDGIDDYVSYVAGTLCLYPTNNFSVEAWINVNEGLAGGSMIFSNGVWNTDGWYFSYFNDNDSPLFVTNQGGAVQSTWGNSSISNVASWHHVVATLALPNALIYNNGTLDVSAADVHLTPLINLARVPMIGARTGPGDLLGGMISPPRLYSYALTPAEVYSHFQSERRWFNV
jgi:hypothetical protein